MGMQVRFVLMRDQVDDEDDEKEEDPKAGDDEAKPHLKEEGGFWVVNPAENDEGFVLRELNLEIPKPLQIPLQLLIVPEMDGDIFVLLADLFRQKALLTRKDETGLIELAYKWDTRNIKRDPKIGLDLPAPAKPAPIFLTRGAVEYLAPFIRDEILRSTMISLMRFVIGRGREHCELR